MVVFSFFGFGFGFVWFLVFVSNKIVMEIEETKQQAKRAMPVLEVGRGNGPLYSLFQFHHDLLQQQQQGRRRRELKRERGREREIYILYYKIR